MKNTKTYILILSMIFIFFFFSPIYGNEVPENRSIYVYSHWYYYFQDTGKALFENLLKEYYNHEVFNIHNEHYPPALSPVET